MARFGVPKVAGLRIRVSLGINKSPRGVGSATRAQDLSELNDMYTLSQSRCFAISDWKPYTKNTLRGFFTVTTPCGIVLHNCLLHDKEGTLASGLFDPRLISVSIWNGSATAAKTGTHAPRRHIGIDTSLRFCQNSQDSLLQIVGANKAKLKRSRGFPFLRHSDTNPAAVQRRFLRSTARHPGYLRAGTFCPARWERW